MRRLSEKLTEYVIKTGTVSSESYDIYQYGFQIGLEMLCCFVTCLSIAIYMHMIPEFAIFTGIFMLLRTYAGGVHLNSFGSCFICSVTVQIIAMYFNSKYKFTVDYIWNISFYPCILRPLWASSEYCHFGLLPCGIAISFGGSIFTEIPQAMSIMAFCIGYFNTVHC